MDFVLEILSGQSDIVNVAIISIFFACLGAAAGRALFMALPRLRLPRLPVYLLFILAFAGIANAILLPVIDEKRKAYEFDTKIDNIRKEYKILDTVFKHYPQEETRFINLISSTKGSEQVTQAAKTFSDDIVTKYFMPNLIMASDTLVSEYVNNSGRILYVLKSTPQACTEYFSGEVSEENLNLIPQELLDEHMDIKARIIEAGVANTVQPQIFDMPNTLKIVFAKYQENGYDPADLNYLSSLQTMDQTEACDIAMRFTYTIISMKELGAQAMKSLVYHQLTKDNAVLPAS